MKLKLAFARTFWVILLEKLTSRFLLSAHVKISREMKMAENSEERIPMISVVAKPCTGPEPKT